MARETLLTDSERFGIHIERIREGIEQLSAEEIEGSGNQVKTLEELQRHTALLESLDHWHYRTVSREAVLLERIFWVQLVLLAVSISHFLV